MSGIYHCKVDISKFYQSNFGDFVAVTSPASLLLYIDQLSWCRVFRQVNKGSGCFKMASKITRLGNLGLFFQGYIKTKVWDVPQLLPPFISGNLLLE